MFQGTLDTNVECKQFIETIVPETFRKVNIYDKEERDFGSTREHKS